jgi:hypothetical protein
VANLASIWTVCYATPSRYNWMLQYYLRQAGLAVSWVGSGRLIFSHDYSDADFEAVADRFEAGLHITQKEQVNGTEDERARANGQPQHRYIVSCRKRAIREKKTALSELVERRLLRQPSCEPVRGPAARDAWRGRGADAPAP